VKTLLLCAVVFLVFFASTACAQGLMAPVAMGAGDVLYFAYQDHTVWWPTGAQLIEIPSANRGIPIRMFSSGGGPVLILYDDNNVFSLTRGGISFFADMTRPDDPTLKPIALALGNGTGLVAAYEDGQVWIYTYGILRHEPSYERENVPSGVGLLQRQARPGIAPNPSSGTCRVSFHVQIEGPVVVQVFDASGRVVRRLLEGPHPAGDYSLTWDGRDEEGREVPGGVYLTRVTTTDATTTGKVTRLGARKEKPRT